MEQAGGIGFREVDSHGNPVTEDSLDPDNPSAQDATGDAARRINPFIVALWLLAVLLIAGGTGFFVGNAFIASPMGGPAPWSYLAIAFAPFAILSGVLAVLALLFWHAAQWQRQQRS